MASFAAARPVAWDEAELAACRLQASIFDSAVSRYNPTPGTGRTGLINVPPNNYPFYNEREKYVPVTQDDGGQLSEWTPMYNPSSDQADADRQAAYDAGVPHGFVAPGGKYKGLPTVPLQVVSELHDDNEYGAQIGEDGAHSGGPFWIHVSPTMRVEDLRKVIRDKGGILPGLQRLTYAGKNMEDSQRTLEQCVLSL